MAGRPLGRPPPPFHGAHRLTAPHRCTPPPYLPSCRPSHYPALYSPVRRPPAAAERKATAGSPAGTLPPPLSFPSPPFPPLLPGESCRRRYRARRIERLDVYRACRPDDYGWVCGQAQLIPNVRSVLSGGGDVVSKDDASSPLFLWGCHRPPPRQLSAEPPPAPPPSPRSPGNISPSTGG